MVQVLIRQPPVYSVTRTPGLRKVGQGWKNDSLYPRSNRRPAFQPLTAEQKQRTDQIIDDFVAEANARMIAPGQKALEEMVDREARAAIEGDTDLNHDYLEGGE